MCKLCSGHLDGGNGLLGLVFWHCLNTLPQAVSLSHLCLPEPQGAIFRPTCIQFSIWREANTVHGPKVSLEVVNLDPGLVVELVQLQVFTSANKYVLSFVQTGRVHWAGNRHLLHLLKGASFIEDHLGAGGNGENVAFLSKLNTTDGCVEVDALHLATSRSVPHSDGLVVAAGEKLLVVRGVHHLLDPRGVPLELHNRLRRLLQVKDSQHLVVTCGRQCCTVVTEVHGLDNVLVLEGQLLLSTECVPHLGGKVGSPCGGFCGVLVYVHTPHSSLVALKGADPVTSVSLTQHRFSVFAGGYGVVDAVGVDLGEGEEDHRPGVTRAGQGSLPQAAHPSSCIYSWMEGVLVLAAPLRSANPH